MCSKPLRGKGFTLVELLVVIAIIGLVVSILLPSIVAAKAQTKFVVCRTNLKTIGEMLQAYAFDNEDRIPRGPSFRPDSNKNPEFKLLDTDIATNQLWTTEYPYSDAPDPTPTPTPGDGSEQGGTHVPEYVGLGLLTKNPGKSGNEFLFCPDDNSLNLSEEGPRIGQPDTNAYGSYLYRQMDIMPNQILEEGKLDNLQGGDFQRCPDAQSQATSIFLEVTAMVLDANSLGSGDAEHTNHDGKRLNMLYKDGSTQPFDNELQSIPESEPVPWASIPGSAFASFPDGVTWALDRIFVAGDYSFISPEPWRAPVPP